MSSFVSLWHLKFTVHLHFNKSTKSPTLLLFSTSSIRLLPGGREKVSFSDLIELIEFALGLHLWNAWSLQREWRIAVFGMMGILQVYMQCLKAKGCEFVLVVRRPQCWYFQMSFYRSFISIPQSTLKHEGLHCMTICSNEFWICLWAMQCKFCTYFIHSYLHPWLSNHCAISYFALLKKEWI